MTGPVGFTVTIKDVYDEMRLMNQRIGELSGQLQSLTTTQSNAAAHRADLETRMRLVEGAKSRLWGGLAVLTGLFAGGGTWVGILLANRH